MAGPCWLHPGGKHHVHPPWLSCQFHTFVGFALDQLSKHCNHADCPAEAPTTANWFFKLSPHLRASMSRMSPKTNWRRGWRRFRNWRFPVSRLSKTRTRYPSSSSCSTRWLPMKPAVHASYMHSQRPHSGHSTEAGSRIHQSLAPAPRSQVSEYQVWHPRGARHRDRPPVWYRSALGRDTLAWQLARMRNHPNLGFSTDYGLRSRGLGFRVGFSTDLFSQKSNALNWFQEAEALKIWKPPAPQDLGNHKHRQPTIIM